MPSYAQLSGNVVVGISDLSGAVDAPHMILIEGTPPVPGSIYEGGVFTPPLPLPPDADAVDAERDRRIEAGFEFGGKLYQSRQQDRENIAGASLAALAAIMNGAQPADLLWHGGSTNFVWIAADNSLTPMDAQTMFAFGQAAMSHKQAMIFAARAIKDADPVPADYADDGYWP